MKLESQRRPAGMFSIGNSSPESRNTSRNPPKATACNAPAWLGMREPTITPKEATQNAYRMVDTKNGLGSATKVSPKYVNSNININAHSASATAMNASTLPNMNSKAEMLET